MSVIQLMDMKIWNSSSLKGDLKLPILVLLVPFPLRCVLSSWSLCCCSCSVERCWQVQKGTSTAGVVSEYNASTWVLGLHRVAKNLANIWRTWRRLGLMKGWQSSDSKHGKSAWYVFRPQFNRFECFPNSMAICQCWILNLNPGPRTSMLWMMMRSEEGHVNFWVNN